MFRPIPFFLILLLLAFWLWMFWDFVTNVDIRGNVKFIWLIGFVFFGIITAIIYYFTEYIDRHA